MPAQPITRIFSFLVLLSLTGGQAQAETAPPSETPADSSPVIQFVGLVPNTGQAILWDAGHKVYRVVKAGEMIRSARVDRVSADGVLITHGSIKVVVPLAPSPFLLRSHADMQGASGPPAVIIAPRRYPEPPPFVGDKPAPPTPKTEAPAAPAEPPTGVDPLPAELEQPPPLPTEKISS